MSNHLLYSIEDKVGILKLNRPEANNALNEEIIEDLDVLIDNVEKDKDVKVLLILGGDDFCAGADVEPMLKCTCEDARKFIYKDVFFKIHNLEIPTIAAVKGRAFAGGLEMALACDLRIIAEDATLGLPEVNLGIMPGAGGSVFLTKVIGASRAKEMILFGSPISGSESFRLGIANKITSSEELEYVAKKYAKKLATRPINSLKYAKKSIDYSDSTFDLQDALLYESKHYSDLFNTKDQSEGMLAYVEHRKPVFLDE